MKPTHQVTKWLAVCLAMALLPACGSLLESTQVPDRTFMLHPYVVSEQGETTGRGLSLEFTVIPGLDSDHMLTLGPDAELNRLAGVRWPDHLPEFLGSLVRQSLEESGRYSKVTDKRSSALDDCSLQLEAREFYTRIDRMGNPLSVSIAISGHHECEGKMTPISLKADAGVNSRRAADVVASHQAAMNRATQSLHQQLESAESQP